MKLVGVSVAKPDTVLHEGRQVSTGIFKRPVAGPVRVGRLNLEGDGQADLAAHGGVDKAVYAYPIEHYAAWQEELAHPGVFPCGQFGENLTHQGLTESAASIGDVLRIGTALLQVSQPRAPCFKLGIRMGRASFPKELVASGRCGFYLRVLEEGELAAGDVIERVSEHPAKLTVAEAFRLHFHDRDDLAGARRACALDELADAWREPLARRLARAEKRDGDAGS